MALEKIEEVKKISKLAKVDPTDIADAIDTTPKVQPNAGVEPNKDYFEALMRQGKTEKTVDIQPTEARSKPSLMDEVRDLSRKADNIAKGGTPQDLIAQAQDVIKQMGTIKDKLQTPNLEIKSSVQTLLRNKLTHIDENIKIALSKAGVEYKPSEKPNGVTNPIERFLGFLTDGQYRLQHLSEEVQVLGDNRESFSPATMLALQLKVSYISQELEFFTSVLNKALESTKTIMNVQV